MNDHASPATRLHDVVVLHDQTHEQWRAAGGEIRNGRIVVAGGRSRQPEGFFDIPAATYTIQATDGANRARRFPNLVLAHHHSRPPKEYVFD